MDRRLLLNISQVGGGGTVTSQKVTGAAPATPTAQTLYNDSFFKAWIKKSGVGTPSIDDHLRMSSITDVAVGRWQPNMSPALGNATYAVCMGVHTSTGGMNRNPASVSHATTSWIQENRSSTDDTLQDSGAWTDFFAGVVGDD